MTLGQWVEQAQVGDACIVDMPSGDQSAIIMLGNGKHLYIDQTSLYRRVVPDSELFLPHYFQRYDNAVPAEIVVVVVQARHDA